MENLTDIVHLQVTGVNQLDKEMSELQGPDTVSYMLDSSAIHRNEIT